MKWVKRILLVLSILGVVAGAIWVMDWLGIFKVKRILATIPVVNRFVTVEGTVYSKVYSSVYEGSAQNQSGLEEVLQRENDGLKQNNDKLQKQVAQLQKAQQQSTAKQAALEQQIASQEASQSTAQGIESQTTQGQTGQGQTSAEDKKYQQLAKYYAEMKPKEALATLDLLSDDVVLGILKHLESDQTAKILAAMDPKRAAALVDNMAR